MHVFDNLWNVPVSPPGSAKDCDERMPGPNGKCPTNEMAVMTSNSRTTVMNDSFWPIIWLVIGPLPAAERVILWLWCGAQYGNVGLGTNTLLDRVRWQEARERRQGMLVCANTEAERVLGEREGKSWEARRSSHYGGRELLWRGTKCLVLDSQRPGFEHQRHLLPAVCACGQVTQPLWDSVSIICKMEQVKPSFQGWNENQRK